MIREKNYSGMVLLFLWFCEIGSSKSNTNLIANSVKLLLGEP
jgi:hypothetical protein